MQRDCYCDHCDAPILDKSAAIHRTDPIFGTVHWYYCGEGCEAAAGEYAQGRAQEDYHAGDARQEVYDNAARRMR